MKAIRIHEFGSADKLVYEDIPVPAIADNQLLVKLESTSVNHLDMKRASGGNFGKDRTVLPWIPGHEFAGIVDSVGKSVTGFHKGDKVYGNCNGGSYAEYLAADTDKTVLMPDNLSFDEAASVPHVGETAWQAIHIHGQLREGQKVLVHGAAGGVGAYAVQFAHRLGAVVYATSSHDDMEFVKSLGADEVIDYKKTDFTTVYKDLDLVLSLVGGDTEERSYQILKKGGRLVSTVGISKPDKAESQGITAIGMVVKQSAEDLQKISDLLQSGAVKTDIAIKFALKDAAKGWKTLSGDSSVPRIGHGKIILGVTDKIIKVKSGDKYTL